MKRIVPAWLALVSAFMALRAWAGTSLPLPTPFPEVRYQQMSAKSPFAVASADAAATAAPTPGFAAQLYVDGVSHIGTKDWVAIKSRDPDQPTLIFLQVGDSTPDGMKVESVKWSTELGKSTVDVSKQGEKATLSFDEAQMAKNVAAPPGPGQPGIRMPMIPGQHPGYPGQPGGPPQPGMAFNRNRIFPQMQPNGAPMPQSGPVQGVDIRRRVHIIQSGVPSGQ